MSIISDINPHDLMQTLEKAAAEDQKDGNERMERSIQETMDLASVLTATLLAPELRHLILRGPDVFIQAVMNDPRFKLISFVVSSIHFYLETKAIESAKRTQSPLTHPVTGKETIH